MDTTADRLTELIAFDGHHLDGDQLAALDASGCLKQLRGQLSRKLLPALWPSTLRAVGEAIATALDVRLADVLVGGWNKYRELARFADPDRYPAEQVNLVALGEHKITSTHEPRVAILAGGATLAELRMRVDVEADIECATLKVQDGRIKEVSTGRCTLKGRLSCEGMQLAEGQRTLTLPGAVSFGSGIPIRGEPRHDTM